MKGPERCPETTTLVVAALDNKGGSKQGPPLLYSYKKGLANADYPF